MAQGAIELDTHDFNTHDEQQQAHSHNFEPPVYGTEFSLPPTDRGKGAWLFLAASWIVEAFVFGFAFSFGVFQDFYSRHEPFAGTGNIAIIGTTMMGILYIGIPFVLALCRLFPRWARWFTLFGLFLAALAMAMSSFCKNVPQLIATQGIMFGIGGIFAYCPCAFYVEEWFAQRKGMAYGIIWSASGFGGVVIPLLLQNLLDKFGFQTATRVCAGVLFVGSAPLSFYIKPRLPYSPNTHTRPFNMRFVMSRLFALHQLANFIQATGYFLPGIFLPAYARMAFGASNFLSALTVILVNITTTMGLTIMGSLSDKVHVTTLVVISSAGTTASVLLIWGFAASLPALYVFCVFYGLFAGCWASIWPGIMKEVSQRGESDGYGYVDPLMVYGHLCIGRGVGNVISGRLANNQFNQFARGQLN